MRKRRLEASACSQLPIWQEPVKEIVVRGGASTNAWPSSPPDPATKLTTPFGRPASSKAFTRRQALSGAALIDKMMIPTHATWNAVFATNEIVIAHKDHSKWTDQITTQNWPEILARPGIRLGRADPDTAPIGYQTLMVWQLAESWGAYAASGAQLSERLQAQCSKDHVVHDEAELLALLESRSIDYAFLFRSTAEAPPLPILAHIAREPRRDR